MGEWSWLFTKYPLADIELIGNPFDAATANVLVRTARVNSENGSVSVTVRVAPHNTAPFRGGPWLHTFAESELVTPGEELRAFRSALFDAVTKCPRRT